MDESFRPGVSYLITGEILGGNHGIVATFDRAVDGMGILMFRTREGIVNVQQDDLDAGRVTVVAAPGGEG
jgi:hypothetical protein